MKAQNNPGCDPELLGIWAFVWGLKREAPAWHKAHTKAWQRRWYEGYDEAKRRSSE